MNRQVEVVVDELRDRLDSHIGMLLALGKWGKERRAVFDQAEWESHVRSNLQYIPGLHVISLIDSSLRVNSVIPLRNESILGADIHQQERIASAFQAARQQRAVTCSRMIEIAQGGQGFIVVLPLYADDHTFVGAAGGVFQYQELFDLFLTHAAPNFSLRIFEEDVEIYRREPGAKSHAAQWRHERLLPLPGISWRVEVTPTLDLLASLRSSLPGMTFVFGLLTSVLVSFMGRSLQQVKQHARENSAITLALRQEMQVRLAAEQELQAARDHLELRVRRRTEELTVLNTELQLTQQAALQQERLRALGQMASGVAHDINNALSPAMLYVGSLLANEPDLSPRAREDLLLVKQTLGDVAHTIDRLRSFQRPSDEHEPMVPLNLNEIVLSAIDLTRARWRDLSQQSGVTFTVQPILAERLPAVLGRDSELREALINLIFNALDAMSEDGTLTLSTATTPTAVVLKVVDTGVGMEEDTRQRCLEPFYTTKGERGTGLGLAMVYGILQRHAAQMHILSEVGGGTTIEITFSLSGAAHENILLAGSEPTERLLPLKILVVDDDALVRKSLGDILRKDRHEVVVVDGGDAGIATFLSAQPTRAFDVVITDLGMPKTDGQEVARRIKSSSPSTPVVLLTGWGRQMMHDGGVSPAVDRLLSKPPNLEEIRKTLISLVPSYKKERIVHALP